MQSKAKIADLKNYLTTLEKEDDEDKANMKKIETYFGDRQSEAATLLADLEASKDSELKLNNCIKALEDGVCSLQYKYDTGQLFAQELEQQLDIANNDVFRLDDDQKGLNALVEDFQSKLFRSTNSEKSFEEKYDTKQLAALELERQLN